MEGSDHSLNEIQHRISTGETEKSHEMHQAEYR
jgi:hypothetical protein